MCIYLNLMILIKIIRGFISTKYQFLKGLFAMGSRGALQDAQQSWLKQRQQCKADVTCLTKAYNERLKQLDAIYDHIDKPL